MKNLDVSSRVLIKQLHLPSVSMTGPSSQDPLIERLIPIPASAGLFFRHNRLICFARLPYQEDPFPGSQSDFYLSSRLKTTFSEVLSCEP